MELVNLIDQRHELVRLALPTRLMAALLHLKHVYALSDEDVVEHWIENPYWQHFSGERYFRHELPCDPSSLVRWRQRIGEEGCEWLLAHSIEAATKAGVIKRCSLEHVVLDTTVQPKAIAHPTDSRLLNRAREQLEQVSVLTDSTPKIALVDRGYRGVEAVCGVRLLVSHTGRLPRSLKKLLKRHQVVEPVIGHMKADGLLGRNWLKGSLGDAMHALLCGAGHNLRMILAHLRVLYFARMGLPAIAAIAMSGAGDVAAIAAGNRELSCPGPTKHCQE